MNGLHFEAALVGYYNHTDVKLRKAFREDLDWTALKAVDFATDKQRLIQWLETRAKELIANDWDGWHIHLGDVPEIFGVSGVRIDANKYNAHRDGMLEADVFLVVSNIFEFHHANELASSLFSEFPYPALCGDWAAYLIWLSFVSCTLAEKLDRCDLRGRWGLARPIILSAGYEDDVALCGKLTPQGWQI